MARFFCLLLLLLTLVGCGQAGDLYLPKHVQPIQQAPNDSLS